MGGAQAVSNLIVVDDQLVFMKANGKSFRTVKRIMQAFEKFLDLKSNAEKSNIYFMPSVDSAIELTGIIGYPIKSLPIKHLGIPLAGRELHDTECNTVLDQAGDHIISQIF